MTQSNPHRPPEWSSVAREQFLVVGEHHRGQLLVFVIVGVLLGIFATPTRAPCTRRSANRTPDAARCATWT